MTSEHSLLARVTAALVAVVGTAGVLTLSAMAGTEVAVGDSFHRDAVQVLGRVIGPPPPAPAQPATGDAAPPRGESGHATLLAPPASAQGLLPVGKGMWIWQPERAEGGDVARIVARARQVGLTHIFVRTGSSRMGFYAGPFLDRILPAAHAAGIRVFGWDFPYFYDVDQDVARSVAAIRHTAPGGHRIDGFVPDIETIHEGTRITAEAAAAFGARLRTAVGSGYPLIAAVPRPSSPRIADYPYTEVLAHMDAVAPMVYWLNRQPDTDVAGAIEFLARFGKPVMPIGQAYDGAPEGGRPGVPPPEELMRFMTTAAAHGAQAVSFWSWQHADQRAWNAIATAPHFVPPRLLPLLPLGPPS